MSHSPLASLWTLDPAITFLNHGSYGACPTPVLEAQARYRASLESEPLRFLSREVEPLLDATRARIGAFVGCDPDDLAFMPNVTTGVSTVLAGLRFEPGDEVLTTNHVYAAVRYALERRLEGTGAKLVVVTVPFPIEDPQQVMDAVLAGVTPHTKLAMLDHITSPTALIFPIRELVTALMERGVDTFVDGAHGPGQVPLALDTLGAAYYAGNCHKWLCAPKGSAFLHVRRDRQDGLRPLVTSHGAGSKRTDRSRFRLEFDMVATADPSGYLAVADAIALPEAHGGWDAWYAANHALVLEARQLLMAALSVPAPCPESMVGAMATLPLPDAGDRPAPPLFHDALQEKLFHEHHIECPVSLWPAWPARVIRVCAQRYNHLDQYRRLADVLRAL